MKTSAFRQTERWTRAVLNQLAALDDTIGNRQLLSIPAWTCEITCFFAAVEMTRMPIILADPRQEDCPIAFANNAFLDLTGYEPHEILGRNCRFLQGDGTDPEAVTALREAIKNQSPIALEILNYKRDGSPFWNAIFMGPVFDQSGELIFFFASQLDVTSDNLITKLPEDRERMIGMPLSL